MKRAPVDITNAERPQGDKPPPSHESPSLQGYWLGGVGALIRGLREENARLRKRVAELERVERERT